MAGFQTKLTTNKLNTLKKQETQGG